MSEMMRHAVFPGNERIEVRESPRPVAGDGEVLVHVTFTALCGSDNRLWRDGARQIPGHEIFGIVDRPGHPRHGERVCVYIAVHCGRCPTCRSGLTQSCDAVSDLVGWDRNGGFAEYVAVPEQCLLPVPDEIDDRLAPLLLDTIGTSAHAVRRAAGLSPPAAGRRVLVTGAGPVGIGVFIALQDAGYEHVEVYDPSATRMAFAKEMGARAEDRNDAERFGLIFECSGAHAARNGAIEKIAPGGAIVLIGENAAPWTINEGAVFRRKDFHMVRSFYFPTAEHTDNVRLLIRKRHLYTLLVDTVFGLGELDAEYPKFARSERLKPLVNPQGRRDVFDHL